MLHFPKVMSLLNKILSKKDPNSFFLTLSLEEHVVRAAVAEVKGADISVVGTGEGRWETVETEVDAADQAVSEAEKNLNDDTLIENVIFGLPATFLSDDAVKPEFESRLKKIAEELNLKTHGFVEIPQALCYYIEKKDEAPPTAFLLSCEAEHLVCSLIRVGHVERHIIVDRSADLKEDFEKALVNFKDEILPSRIIIYDHMKPAEMEKLKEDLHKFPWHKHSSFLHTPKIEILSEKAIMTALIAAAGTGILKEFHPGGLNKEEIANVTEAAPETFGFEKDTDVGEKAVVPPLIKPNPTAEPSSPFKSEDNGIIPEENPKVPFYSKLTAFFPKKLPRFSFPVLSFAFAPALVLAFAALILFLAGGYIYRSFPTAEVHLIVYPFVTRQPVDVLFTTDSSRKESAKNAIIATEISDETTGDKTAPATGKTQVGDAAHGQIIIYNKTTNSKTFPRGTILTNGDLRFTLDQETSIASASDTGEGLTFGKTTANITSADIGPAGNLAAGSVFAVKDLPDSSFSAKNAQSLTGGTSRDVTSVSKDDQNALLAALTDELTQAVKQKLMQKLQPGEKLLEKSTTVTVKTKKFSQDAGSQASNVSLSLGIKVTGLKYNESDLASLANTNVTSVPTGFIVDNGRTSITVTEATTEKNGDIKATATIAASFLPEIDTGKVRNQITGKTYSEASDLISKNGNIGGVEIVSVKSLPLMKGRLPLKTANIEVTVVSR